MEKTLHLELGFDDGKGSIIIYLLEQKCEKLSFPSTENNCQAPSLLFPLTELHFLSASGHSHF